MQRSGNSAAPPHALPKCSIAVLALFVFRLVGTHVLVVFVVLHLLIPALFVLCFLLRIIFSCIIFRHKNFSVSKKYFYERLFLYLPRLFFPQNTVFIQ